MPLLTVHVRVSPPALLLVVEGQREGFTRHGTPAHVIEIPEAKKLRDEIDRGIGILEGTVTT